MNKEEIWKAIEGYEGYEISNLGKVKSMNYSRTDKEKIMKPCKNNYGYLVVYLYRNRKRKLFYVHRLVAAAFIQNPKGFEQVNHIDENKSNNAVENLEFCNAKYNINYGTRNERMAFSKSKAVEASKYPDFREICLRFSSSAEAGRNGFAESGVGACCRGCYNREGNNRYKNLYWRFAV